MDQPSDSFTSVTPALLQDTSVMPAPEKIIDQVVSDYHAAAEAAASSPLRSGNIDVLNTDTASEVMITADLHGHRRNFQRILEIAALDEHPHRHLIMQEVCHGGPTYPDSQSCMSHLMLEEVAALKLRYGPRFHFLLSNHELAELTDFPIMKAKRMLNLLFRCGLQEMYGDEADRVREAAIRFIAASPLAVRLPGGIMACHSLPTGVDEAGFDADVFQRDLTEQDTSEKGSVFRMVWGRDYRQENADAFAAAVDAELFITGHEPCERGFQVPNTRQIIVDCCRDLACYIMLSLGTSNVTQRDILGKVRYLHDSTEAVVTAES